MSAKEFKWKPDQEQVLKQKGDLVLTASAGTGKTTILVEKFASKLLELANEKGDSSVLQNLAGITFTDLAAAEMKARIREKIVDTYTSDHPVSKQILIQILRDLDSAYIGTIHGFCNRLLSENFVAAELSPGFGIIPQEEAEEYQLESALTSIRNTIKNDPLILEDRKSVV